MKKVKSTLDQIQSFLFNKGVPFPLFRDNGKPSLSFTLVIITFIIWCAGILQLVPTMDLSKAENMLMICGGLYWGRKLTKDKQPTTLEGEESSEPK